MAGLGGGGLRVAPACSQGAQHACPSFLQMAEESPAWAGERGEWGARVPPD